MTADLGDPDGVAGADGGFDGGGRRAVARALLELCGNAKVQEVQSSTRPEGDRRLICFLPFHQLGRRREGDTRRQMRRRAVEADRQAGRVASGRRTFKEGVPVLYVRTVRLVLV